MNWDRSSEDIARNFFEISSTNVWCHAYTSQLFKDRENWFALPRLVLSSMVASTALALEYVKDAQIKSYVLVGVAAFGIINGLVGSLSMHFKYAELSGTHRAMGESWNALCRRIELCLKKPVARRPEVERFLEECAADFSRLSESSPEIPTCVISAFRYKFKLKINEDEMAVAHFLNGLHPLKPYIPSDEDEEKNVEMQGALL